MLQLPHCKKHSCALRAGHACHCVAVPPPPLQPPDWPAKVTARSAGGRSLAVTCYWRHNLPRSSLHWTKRWTGLNLTLRVNDRYPKFWYFVKRPYWWISALGLKWMVWNFGTNWAKSEEVIAKKQGLTGSEIHSRWISCGDLWISKLESSTSPSLRVTNSAATRDILKGKAQFGEGLVSLRTLGLNSDNWKAKSYKAE